MQSIGHFSRSRLSGLDGAKAIMSADHRDVLLHPLNSWTLKNPERRRLWRLSGLRLLESKVTYADRDPVSVRETPESS